MSDDREALDTLQRRIAFLEQHGFRAGFSGPPVYVTDAPRRLIRLGDLIQSTVADLRKFVERRHPGPPMVITFVEVPENEKEALHNAGWGPIVRGEVPNPQGLPSDKLAILWDCLWMFDEEVFVSTRRREMLSAEYVEDNSAAQIVEDLESMRQLRSDPDGWLVLFNGTPDRGTVEAIRKKLGA